MEPLPGGATKNHAGQSYSPIKKRIKTNDAQKKDIKQEITCRQLQSQTTDSGEGTGGEREGERERKRSTSEAAEKQGLQRQTDCLKGQSINIDPNAVTTGIAESAGA